MLNYRAGQIVANSVQVGAGEDGMIKIYSFAGMAHFVIDVNGYYADAGAGASTYRPYVPQRFFDSRDTNARLEGGTRRVFSGACPACTGALTAYVFNLTVTGTTAAGYFTVYPGTSTTVPLSSNINFGVNETVAVTVITQLDPNGDFAIFNGSGGPAQYIIDDVGYFVGQGTDSLREDVGWFVPVEPVRVADGRPETSPTIGSPGPVQPNTPVTHRAMGLLGIPPTEQILALVTNLTVTPSPAQLDGYLVAYSSALTRPPTSNVNFQAGQTVANQAIFTIGNSNNVSFFSNGRFYAINDVFGYYTLT